MSSGGAIRLSYHNSLLHNDDVDLLCGPFWLNDLLIGFYLEYLEHDLFRAHSDRLLFVSPEVTQCMKLVSAAETSLFLDPLGAAAKHFIFFPINDHQAATSAGGSHWSLLIYSRPDRRFFSVDSSGDSNRRATQTFVNNVRRVLMAGDDGDEHQQTPVQPVRCEQQSNGYDCGVHVLWNVEWLAGHAVKTGSLREASSVGVVEAVATVGEMRGQILELIGRLAAANPMADGGTD